jgi:hypothetical protein
VVYGVALATAGRQPVFEGRAAAWMSETLDRRATEQGWTLVKKNLKPDHLAVIVRVAPNHGPDLVALRIRQAADAARRGHPADFPGGAIWAAGYAVTTDPEQLPEMTRQLLALATSY